MRVLHHLSWGIHPLLYPSTQKTSYTQIPDRTWSTCNMIYTIYMKMEKSHRQWLACPSMLIDSSASLECKLELCSKMLVLLQVHTMTHFVETWTAIAKTPKFPCLTGFSCSTLSSLFLLGFPALHSHTTGGHTEARGPKKKSMVTWLSIFAKA